MEQNNQIQNYSKVLDKKYGAEGTKQRIAFRRRSLCLLYRTNIGRSAKKSSPYTIGACRTHRDR